MDPLVCSFFEVKKQEILDTYSKKLKTIGEKIVESPDALINPGISAEKILDVLTRSAKEIVDALINSYREVQEKTGQNIILEKHGEIKDESSHLVTREIERIRSELKLLWKSLFDPEMGIVRQEDFEDSLRECMAKIRNFELDLIKQTENTIYTLGEVERRKKATHQSLRKSKMIEQNIRPCGPLAKLQCDLEEKIEKEFSNKNIFLDIPYSNYDDCEEALRNLLKKLDLNSVIAKDRLTSNAILCKVCALIKTCKYGIADISSASNSVSYEYGLMHGLGKKVCLVMRSESEKFTDIHGLEHISYDGLGSFRIAIAKWILHNIEEVDKTKVEQIIELEEKALKESGDILLKKIGTISVEHEKESEKEQQNSLKMTKEQFNTFVRKYEAEWATERDSEPYTIEEGKLILRRLCSGLLEFRSILEGKVGENVIQKIDEVMKNCKVMQKHQLSMDGGESFRKFWQSGDSVIQALKQLLS